MPGGTQKAVLRKATEAAKRWRGMRVQSLRKCLSATLGGAIRIPWFASGASRETRPSATDGYAVDIGVQTNSQALLERLQFELYGFFDLQPSKASAEAPPVNDRTAGPFPTAVARVGVHDGAPRGIGYPYSLSAEETVFATAVTQSEFEAAERYQTSHMTPYNESLAVPRWERPHFLGDAPHHVRWITQPLLDGFVSRRVEAHVGLSTGHMPNILSAARRFHEQLPPRSLSPYFYADELLATWGVFGEGCAEDFSSVHTVLRLAQVSAMLPLQQGLWLRGSAVVNRSISSTGHERTRIVLFVGGPRSGKTTAALHCLTASEDTALVGAEDVTLAMAPQPSLDRRRAAENGGSDTVVVSGLPGPVTVGVGAVLGTLRANPPIAAAARLAQAGGGGQGSVSAAAVLEPAAPQLLRNSDHVLWGASQAFQVHVSEAYGRNRWQPAAVGELAGIIVLNWDVPELSRRASAQGTTITKAPGVGDALRCLRRLTQSHRERSLFKGHYLVRSIYGEQLAARQLEEMLAQLGGSGGAPVPLYEVGGAVSFDAVVGLVQGRLFG